MANNSALGGKETVIMIVESVVLRGRRLFKNKKVGRVSLFRSDDMSWRMRLTSIAERAKGVKDLVRQLDLRTNRPPIRILVCGHMQGCSSAKSKKKSKENSRCCSMSRVGSKMYSSAKEYSPVVYVVAPWRLWLAGMRRE